MKDFNKEYLIQTIIVASNNLRMHSDKIECISIIKEFLSDDNELENSVSAMNETDLIYYGVGLFGKNEVVKELTKNFKLWS